MSHHSIDQQEQTQQQQHSIIARRIHTITNQLHPTVEQQDTISHNTTRQYHYFNKNNNSNSSYYNTHGRRNMSQQEKQVKKIVVTGAAGQICYSLLPMIASGRMLGPDQPVILHLLEIPQAMDALRGVVMELEDCAFPLLRGVVPTSDAKEAFTDVDVAILVGAFPRKEGMERKDLLEKNVGIFKVQGKALNDHAKRDVKVRRI